MVKKVQDLESLLHSKANIIQNLLENSLVKQTQEKTTRSLENIIQKKLEEKWAKHLLETKDNLENTGITMV